MLLLMRVLDGPPAVPSEIVKCSKCTKNCWLPMRGAQATMALAALAGNQMIICEDCMMRILNML